jgi:hypothetical protein
MNFLQSPLARRPRLLGRKIIFRLGLHRRDVRVPVPAVAAVAYPAHWARALRAWIQTVPLASAPHPFHRVFGQEFDEALLLKLCREGPRRGENGLTGDIKLVWDYSRGQPLFTNAAAGPEYLEFCVAFLRRWREANADTKGPAWSCAMEIAIRAANWIFADVLFGGELGRQLGTSDWANWLWRDGWLVWQRLEARLVSSNHYLADLLGLFLVGAIFPEDVHARRWHRFARSEFSRALLAQTRSDGGLCEASLRYHAFVTEMALLFRLAQGAPFPPAAEVRLRDMCRIVADFRDATGDVFALGDDDSGRVLAVDFASPVGRADSLLRLASAVLGEEFRPSAGAVYPESGWWVCRAGDFAVALDFGGVGLHGRGSHAHNDDFSFCLDWRERTVIADPGTFLYTSDRAARNRFRSTFYHNTLAVDGREQRKLSDEPFLLPGRDQAFPATRLGEDAWAFQRPVGPAITHRREISVRGESVSIRDVVEGSGRHKLQWRFHLHPAVQPGVTPRGFTLVVPKAGTLLLEAPQIPVALDIVEAEYSPGYGCRQPALACVVSHEATLPFAAEWRIRAVDKP